MDMFCDAEETTFSDFLEWLFSEDHIKILQPVMKAGGIFERF